MWDIPDVSDPARRGKKSGRYLWRRFFPHTESISMENWPGKWGILTEKTYMDRVMNRVFTFQGSGVVEIVIAVADKSHIRSGIQAIPVLGSPVRVSIQRGLRVLGSGCAIAFCICIMFGTLMVHVRTRTKRILLFFNLVCLCVAGYSLCSLVHNFFSSSHKALVCPGNYDLLSDPFLYDPA